MSGFSSSEAPVKHQMHMVTRSIRINLANEMQHLYHENINISKPLWAWSKMEVLELFRKTSRNGCIKPRFKAEAIIEGLWLENLILHRNDALFRKVLFASEGNCNSRADIEGFLDSLEVIHRTASEARYFLFSLTTN